MSMTSILLPVLAAPARRAVTLVRYSMRAKFHEGRNDEDEDMQHRHGIARHAHELAARISTESTSARRYHLRMARFHKERGDHHGRRAHAQQRAADARARGQHAGQ